MEEFYELLTFSSRMAVFALRTADVEDVRVALLIDSPVAGFRPIRALRSRRTIRGRRIDDGPMVPLEVGG